MLATPPFASGARLEDVTLTGPAKGVGDAATKKGRRANVIASGSCMAAGREKKTSGRVAELVGRKDEDAIWEQLQ